MKIILIICTIFLGGFMVYGGIGKFAQDLPKPTAQIEQYEKVGLENAKANKHLKIKNYIFGLKQTNYFWQMLGICELVFGLLILSQVFSLIGSIVNLPISINIFLFHLFLEPHEIGELLLTFALLVANIVIIAYFYKKWKHLLKNKPFIKLSSKA